MNSVSNVEYMQKIIFWDDHEEAKANQTRNRIMKDTPVFKVLSLVGQARSKSQDQVCLSYSHIKKIIKIKIIDINHK